MEEIENAGNALSAALDRYLSACSKTNNLSLHQGILCNIDPGKINAEIAHLSSRELKLREAATAVYRLRNRVSQLTPVASLPPELLIKVFHSVSGSCVFREFRETETEDSNSRASISSREASDVDSESGTSENSGSLCHKNSLDNFPSDLESIVHVCFRWRQVAIGTPSLWTHIDFTPHKSFHPQLLSRAEIYIARAEALPIELHVIDSDPFAYDEPSLRRFISSIYNRVKSFEVTVSRSWKEFHSLFFREVFREDLSSSTSLTRFITHFSMADDTDEFIDCIEDINRFSHLTVLHLRGLFPFWNSTAHHNLVDLRLNPASDEYWTSISQPEFRGILQASPRLRILHFGLHIIKRNQDDEPIPPVHLSDLEELNLSTDRGEEFTTKVLGDVLQLLAPGSKPLWFSIWHNFRVYNFDDSSPKDDDTSLQELSKIFQRSNVIKFRAKALCPPLDRLLCYAPNLEDLVFDSCVFPWRANEPFQRGSMPSSRLKSLSLYYCSPSLEQLELLLEQHPTNLLILSE